MREGLIIGIDIGGTNFRIGAVDRQGKVHKFVRQPVGQVLRGGDAIAELGDFIKAYAAGLPGEASAVAIGFPAPLDKARKTVLQAPNIPYLQNLPVTEPLSRRLGIPVVIERDVNMLLSCDMQALGLTGEGVTCAFYFGTGVGNAIFIDGRPYVGKNGAAGELGHIPVWGSGELCGCGNRGCIENHAGGKRLAALGGAVAELFLHRGDSEELEGFVDAMACAVAAELNILDPDNVIIGGGVVNMQGFPRERLAERIYAHARKPYPAESLNILFAPEAEDKGVVGAALYCGSILLR